MLSLQLKSGEYLTIGDNIAVQIFEQSGSSFRVAVKAPREIPILRGEVRERTGERPDGLRTKRPKSPSERKYDAKHFEQWTQKKEQRKAREKQQEEERAAIVQELMAITDRLDELASAHGAFDASEVRDKLKDLRCRIDKAAEESAENTNEKAAE